MQSQSNEPGSWSNQASVRKSDVSVQMWEFEDAPSNLKQLVSKEFAGGWLALVYSCGGTDFAGSLAACWRSLGLSLVLHRTEDGGTLLAGLHPETAAALNEVAGD